MCEESEIIHDLTCLGELLIDFVQSEDGGQDGPSGMTANYRANPGGAPGNVACAAQVFGLETAFIGAVGEDAFGELLLHALARFGVDTKGVSKIDEAMTTLAFVSLDEEGDRSFSFIRNGSADTRLRLREVDRVILEQTRALHVGTLSLTDEPARGATLEAVRCAVEAGTIVSFDPNVRLNLWKDVEALREATRSVLPSADILKISHDDLEILYPGLLSVGEYEEMNTRETVIEALMNDHGIQLLILTLGKHGSEAYWRTDRGLAWTKAPTDLSRQTIDTTGAGDIFTGALLSRVLTDLREGDAGETAQERLKLWLNDCGEERVFEDLLFANRVASLSTEKMGGITSIPSVEDYAASYG